MANGGFSWLGFWHQVFTGLFQRIGLLGRELRQRRGRIAVAGIPMLWLGLGILGLQIALGGWTSANYAALSCGSDFPTCLGQWWPQTDFREGFVLWRGIGVDYEGGLLDGPARVAIQLTHRIFAVIVALYLFWLSWRLWRMPGLRGWGGALALGVVLQWLLGIGNVVMGLPLWMATAHTAGAIALLFILVSLLARLRPA